MFRCDKKKAVERAQRVRRQPINPMSPTRPCVNGAMAGSANGEDECGGGDIMVGEAASGLSGGTDRGRQW